MTPRVVETKGKNMKKDTRDSFPLTIKKRGAKVRIYKGTNRRNGYSYDVFTVTYIGPDGRERKNFADLDEAKREAARTAEKLAGFDADGLRLTGDDARRYLEACDTIKASGSSLPIHAVAHEYARAREILGGDKIVEAARYFKKHVDVDLPQVTVAEAVEKFRAAKQAEGMSAMYLKDIRTLLGDFAKDFQCPLSSIQPDDLRQYLNGKKVGLVSKENRRRMLVVLFNFAKAQGWLQANEGTAADALGTYKVKQREVEIYKPAEVRRLLGAADPDFLPYIALIAFGGVRREELHKGLSWDAINFDRGTITVPAAIAKTGRKRKIVMSENLLQWLAPYRVKSGPIFKIDPRKRIAKIVKASGVKWKRNALRHSFGSYRMEQTKNEGLVALEMGNSPKVVKDHYFEIVDEQAAREYWSIKPLPRDDHKIVAIA
jgi:integrase